MRLLQNFEFVFILYSPSSITLSNRNFRKLGTEAFHCKAYYTLIAFRALTLFRKKCDCYNIFKDLDSLSEIMMTKLRNRFIKTKIIFIFERAPI